MTAWMELADYVVAGTALLVGLAAGRRSRPKPPPPVRPFCTCTHGYGSHEDGGLCHGKVDEPTKYDVYGTEVAWKKVQCTCLRYDGPDPAIFGL
jgi:hypothetical protein